MLPVKYCILILVAALLTPCMAGAQQGLTAEQKGFITATYNTISNALPLTYRNWKTDTLDLFEPEKIATDSGMGRTRFFTTVVKRRYARRAMDAAGIRTRALNAVVDFTSNDSMARFQKTMAGNKVEITVITNIGSAPGTTAPDITLDYCATTKPLPIEVPIPAALAALGLQPGNCTVVMPNNLFSFDMNHKYSEDAVVFWGTAIRDKVTPPSATGALQDQYHVDIDRSKMSSLVNQNMVVIIRGNEADIDEMLVRIDWKALAGLTSK